MVVDKLLPAVTVDCVLPPTAHELQARYLAEVLGYVSSFVRPLADAEDVVMEVFQAAFIGLHKLKRKDDPRVWLLGIARRKVANALRLRYRRAETSLLFADGASQDDQRKMEQNALVQEVLAQIPQDQREALVLKYANGLSTREVAAVLGRSEAAANSLLQRAREAFTSRGAHLSMNDPEVDHVSN